MDFLKFWILWALVGLAVAVWLFYWSLRSRQYQESRRAALLPFDDIEPEEPTHKKEGRFHLYLLFGLVITGLALISATLVLVFVPR